MKDKSQGSCCTILQAEYFTTI